MAWGLALLGAALVVNTIAGSIYTRREIHQAAAELQAEVAMHTARRVQSFMLRKIERLQDAAVAMTLYPLGGEEQKLMGMLLLKNDRAFTELAILDTRGDELTKFSQRRVYVRADLRNQRESGAFKTTAADHYYVSGVETTIHAEPYVTMAVPLKAGPRQVIGSLIVKANLKVLWELVGASTFGKGGYSYLVDDRGKVIAHRDPSLVLKGLNLRRLPKVQRFLRSQSPDPQPAEEGPGVTGQQVLSSYARVPDFGWGVVVEEPVSVALADLEQLHRYALLLLGVGLIIGAVIIVWVSRKITQPIQQLRKDVEEVRHGRLDHRTDIRTGDEIEELAEDFNKMTEALQNSYATLEQQVQQRTREISALYDVTTTVNQSLDLDAVLHQVIKKITEIFYFNTTRIFLFNKAGDQLELRDSFAANPEQWQGVGAFKCGESNVGYVAQSGEPLIFEDINSDPRYRARSTKRATERAGLRFFALFPIKTQSRIFGTILFNADKPRQLTTDEIRLLQSMAEQIAVAIEKATHYEEARTRAQHLAVLNRIGAAVSRSLDLEIILQEAVKKISEALGFDAAWIYQLDAKDGHLHLRAHKGLSEEMAQSMAVRSVDMGISGEVMKTGQRLVFEDVQNDARYRELTRGGKVKSLGFQTASAFPIRIKHRVMGTFHAANRTRRHFAPDELQLMESIAQEIGVAVENATLFGQVQETTSELAKTNEELREATRAKSEFIAAMSHELRSPLQIIIGNSDLTGDGFFGDINAEQKDAMQKISRNARVLLKMINDVLALSRLDARKMAVEVTTVEVDEIISNARTHVEQINRDNHLEVRWNIDNTIPPFETDPIKLEEILQNLIGNAFKFTERGFIEVGVRNLSDQDRVQFSVSDTGVGIEAEDLERIFKEFEQVRGGHLANFDGVGLGLSIVKKYLDLLHGDIQVESCPGQGSTFTFSVPRSVSSICEIFSALSGLALA
ncbi:MAG: GAF domain-containing protein [Alphaproteobacteria bacterium]